MEISHKSIGDTLTINKMEAIGLIRTLTDLLSAVERNQPSPHEVYGIVRTDINGNQGVAKFVITLEKE